MNGDKNLNPCKCGSKNQPDTDSDDMVPCWMAYCTDCKQRQHSETSEWSYWGAVNKWNKENPK
jgi:hypothetical protein